MRDRRKFLKDAAAAGLGAGLLARPARATASTPVSVPRQADQRYQGGRSPWPICLDTSTIRPASLEEKVRIADEAGFDAIEPWDGELADYEENGGDLEALGREIRDRGLFVPSVIGLWQAIPPTQEAWEESLEANRERLRMVSAVGAEHVQVVPQPSRESYDLDWCADRYRDLIEIGIREYDVKPALVFVEFLPIRRLSDAAAIALRTDHPEAKIIPDVFHMYIGGSGFNGLRHISGDFISIFQFNDAPANPPREELTDEDRVFPGDGIFPLTDILQDLRATGFEGCISLELYNPDYYERDLMQVAQEGLEKTVGVIEEAGV